MATLPPVTDTIARFVTETDLSAVSAKTRVNATMHILDVLGVALAGVSTPPAEIALDYCKRLGVVYRSFDLGHPCQGICFHCGLCQRPVSSRPRFRRLGRVYTCRPSAPAC